MSSKEQAKVDQITQNVLKQLKTQLRTKFSDSLAAFAKLYFSNVAHDELAAHSTAKLSGAVQAHWDFLQILKPAELKIRVYNPDIKRNGWESQHTTVEIVTHDMPFIVDSICMELNRLGWQAHGFINVADAQVERDAKGNFVKLYPHGTPVENKHISTEAYTHIAINKRTDAEALKALENALQSVLSDVQAAVDDWQLMQKQMRESIHQLELASSKLDPEEMTETCDFLEWLLDYFTFLGARYYRAEGEGSKRALRLMPGSGLGVLQNEDTSRTKRRYSELPPEARKLATSKQIMYITKTKTRSTVHRNTHTDYISIKHFSETGDVVGEWRFIGLFTSAAYNSDPLLIPVLRRKVEMIMRRSGLTSRGYSKKQLSHIVKTIPRDELFQASTDDLYDLVMGILHIQERRCTRLFLRQDAFQRFVSCLVFLPRDNFNTRVMSRIEKLILKACHGHEVSSTPTYTNSVLARIHIVVQTDSKEHVTIDKAALQQEIENACMSWNDRLSEALQAEKGEEAGNATYGKYAHSFTAGYQEATALNQVINDIDHLDKLSDTHTLEMSCSSCFHPKENHTGLNLRIFSLNNDINLSDALPVLEHMGLKIISEYPYRITLPNGDFVSLSCFKLCPIFDEVIDIAEIWGIFRDCLERVWTGTTENDGYNSLVLVAGLNWRQVNVLRAYASYAKQVGNPHSDRYIQQVLAKHPKVAAGLIQLFELRFDPSIEDKKRAKAIDASTSALNKLLETVSSLDEDRILRLYERLILVTVRTNYFQDSSSTYLAFKLHSRAIDGIPEPKPLFEIFVYSPRFEGVHLRMAKVARGGLRWSDRFEDFRTEILGLVKAQEVKNALIVPSGAKGGFVVKRKFLTREENYEEGVACYKLFISSLLDLTDNYGKNNQLIAPKQTVCIDEPDPYLVVAADKGTASFSDIANAVAVERGFWLGDAFASGGCTGYDHKKMGITAKGGWASVVRHMHDSGRSMDDPFSVVGVGDMSGDVFGNGMLLSKQIKLIAAFNHLSIFIDPNPDPATSFKERKRLFELPRSNWTDYNTKLISKGGGIFDRTAKSIKLSKQIKEALDIAEDQLAPNALMQAILRANVDLLWNGGIGTYVKAQSETDTQVGDRSNDAIRVDGHMLRCKIIGEGGNLGLTQLGRVEYALHTGGRVNTDFIDNSAGVDCSDHEVNIKILLNSIMDDKRLKMEARNTLLAKMTDDVSELVLHHNYRQNLAISLAAESTPYAVDILAEFLSKEVKRGNLNRKLEFLPDEKTLRERKATGQGFVRPEISVLLAYSKNILKRELLDTQLPDDKNLEQYLFSAFPKPLIDQYADDLNKHRLKREIIATQLSNAVVRDMGITFVQRMQDELDADLTLVVKSYVSARRIFDMGAHFAEIEALAGHIEPDLVRRMMLDIMFLVRRTARWLIRNRSAGHDIQKTYDDFAPLVSELATKILKIAPPEEMKRYDARLAKLKAAGVKHALAGSHSMLMMFYPMLNVIEAHLQHKSCSLENIAKVFFGLEERLRLTWLRESAQHIVSVHDERWALSARAEVKSDLDRFQRLLIKAVLKHSGASGGPDAWLNSWAQENEARIARWVTLVSEFQAYPAVDFAMFSVALRRLSDLAG